MKIALVTPYSWSEPGGVNIHVASLSKHLKTRGHEVMILAPSDKKTDDIIWLGKTRKIKFNDGIARLVINPAIGVKVRSELIKFDPDVVHIHAPLAPTVSLAAGAVSRAPIVVTFHSGADAPYLQSVRAMLRQHQKRFTVALAVSERAKQVAEQTLTVPIKIIPNGLDISLYKDVGPASGKTVLFFGRLEKRKGPQVLAAALPRLFKQVPDAKVIYAGDGILKDYLKEKIPDGFGKQVTFAGEFDDTKRVKLLEESSIVCLPAKGESFGYTLVEAMAAGRATVCSNDAGYLCVATNGKDAVMKNPDRPSEFADSLADLLNNPEKAAKIAKNARTTAKKYDWKIIVEHIEQAYKDAISTPRPTRTEVLKAQVRTAHERAKVVASRISRP